MSWSLDICWHTYWVGLNCVVLSVGLDEALCVVLRGDLGESLRVEDRGLSVDLDGALSLSLGGAFGADLRVIQLLSALLDVLLGSFRNVDLSGALGGATVVVQLRALLNVVLDVVLGLGADLGLVDVVLVLLQRTQIGWVLCVVDLLWVHSSMISGCNLVRGWRVVDYYLHRSVPWINTICDGQVWIEYCG